MVNNLWLAVHGFKGADANHKGVDPRTAAEAGRFGVDKERLAKIDRLLQTKGRVEGCKSVGVMGEQMGQWVSPAHFVERIAFGNDIAGAVIVFDLITRHECFQRIGTSAAFRLCGHSRCRCGGRRRSGFYCGWPRRSGSRRREVVSVLLGTEAVKTAQAIKGR